MSDLDGVFEKFGRIEMNGQSYKQGGIVTLLRTYTSPSIVKMCYLCIFFK